MALVLLLLAPKMGRFLTIVVLVAMTGCLVHPILELAWVRNAVLQKTKSIRFVFLMIVAVALVGIFGVYVWPPSRRHTLSESESRAFASPLMAQTSPRETIKLGCAAADENTCVYAGQFLDLFREAGWLVQGNQVERVTLAKPMAGVILFQKGTGKLDPNNWRSGLWTQASPSIENVRRAFLNIGVEPEAAVDANYPSGVLGVYFGSEKENPSERTALTDMEENIEKWRRDGTIPVP